MITEALFVTLRVPDPAALTALEALRGLRGTAPARLQRGRLWCHGGQPGMFGDPAGVWLNPNKERGVAWLCGPNPWAAPASPEAWVLARDRDESPETPVLRALGERGRALPAGLFTATLWRMEFPPGADPLVLAGEAAVVRDARHGLLVNPHAQAHVVCAPPAGLEELARAMEWLSP